MSALRIPNSKRNDVLMSLQIKTPPSSRRATRRNLAVKKPPMNTKSISKRKLKNLKAQKKHPK